MFNKNDFINWAQTAQNDNKAMQDFRSSHFNPMKQVKQVEVAEWVQVAKTIAMPVIKKVSKEVVKGVATTGTQKVIDVARNKINKQKPEEPQESVRASYESRKEAGMRAMREFFGHQKKLGLGKDQVKQRAKQSQDAYDKPASSGFKFGRPLAHQEPKEKPKV